MFSVINVYPPFSKSSFQKIFLPNLKPRSISVPLNMTSHKPVFSTPPSPPLQHHHQQQTTSSFYHQRVFDAKEIKCLKTKWPYAIKLLHIQFPNVPDKLECLPLARLPMFVGKVRSLPKCVALR